MNPVLPHHSQEPVTPGGGRLIQAKIRSLSKVLLSLIPSGHIKNSFWVFLEMFCGTLLEALLFSFDSRYLGLEFNYTLATEERCPRKW